MIDFQGGSDLASSDTEIDESVVESIMIGGAYLTCWDDSDRRTPSHLVYVGCAQVHGQIKQNLKDKKPNWTVYIGKSKTSKSPIAVDNGLTQKYHARYEFGKNEIENVEIRLSLTISGQTYTSTKPLESVDSLDPKYWEAPPPDNTGECPPGTTGMWEVVSREPKERQWQCVPLQGNPGSFGSIK
jgi:hypothetical protein